MPVFKRKPGTGSHTFVLNGKRIRVRPLDEVECQPEDLAPFVDKYELISQRKRRDSRSPLEAEVARYEQLLRPHSWILNPEWTAPHGALVYTPPPSDRAGQQALLSQLGARLAGAEHELKAVREEWAAQVESDPMRELTEKDPRGDFLDKIARRTAQCNHLQAEINEIRRRLEALEPIEHAETSEYRRRRFMCGSLKKYAGVYTEVDGYAVEYDADDKPVVPELGCTLREYLDRVREHKRAARAA